MREIPKILLRIKVPKKWTMATILWRHSSFNFYIFGARYRKNVHGYFKY